MKQINLPHLEASLLREVLLFLNLSPSRTAWLVGGAMRKLLCGETELDDIDIALSFNPIESARKYAKATGAGFVVLDDERKIVRVARAVNNRLITFDLSMFRANGINNDLAARDFTINAIASSLNDFLSQSSDKIGVFDPLNGFEHLKKRLLVPCSDTLFIDDPLRLMRAFRFSALYNAAFSDGLYKLISSQSELLKRVSQERIRDELFKVLNIANSTKWVRLMHETGVLKAILPELAQCEGVLQNEWHHLDVFYHSLATLENLEKLLSEPHSKTWSGSFEGYLSEEISAGRSFKQNLKLACLLHDLGKPSCKRKDEKTNRIIFYGHEMRGADIAKNIAKRLHLSVNESNFLIKVIKNHMRPGVIIQQGCTDRRLYKFYAETGRDGVGIAFLSLADRLSALKNITESELKFFIDGIFFIIDKFYEQLNRPKIVPLISGEDLINTLHITPGPIFKTILAEIKEAQFLGEITTKEQALALAARRSQQ